MGYCYILRCTDGSYYIGSTTDLAARLAKHENGTGSRYTSQRRPVEMVYAEEYPDITRARDRERQLKCWTRAKKEALITGDGRRLKAL